MSGSHRRREYEAGDLSEDVAGVDPLALFGAWLQAAEESDAVDEAHAMTVATVTPQGLPSARVVLLRGFDDGGFVFFTNYDSDKGEAIAANPVAALVFYWGPLERQIRIEGDVAKVSTSESDEYFRSRPHRSKLGALISRQSAVIPNRASLEEELEVLQAQYPEGAEVPRPQHWGGYRVTPRSIEFWHGRRSRLHDRIRYRRLEHEWVVERLAP